jgi:hypothetical protein
MSKQLFVTKYETERYTQTITVDDDFPIDNQDWVVSECDNGYWDYTPEFPSPKYEWVEITNKEKHEKRKHD